MKYSISPHHYHAPDPQLWQGRADSLPGERFFQCVRYFDFSQTAALPAGPGFALLGFACDTGVRRNLGRAGAAAGPEALRRALAKLPIHRSFQFIDCGDIRCPDDDLETAQSQLATAVACLRKAQLTPIVIGGGHETAWGHYQGLVQHTASDIAIINFDAHFDMRPLLTGQKGSSGTPFLQIAQACQNKQRRFNYLCIGVQSFGNTASLYHTAQTHHVRMITAETIYAQSPTVIEQLDDFLSSHEAIYVSLCLDVFAQAFAPGVSAPQPLGLMPWHVITLLRHIMTTNKVISFDIVELAPPLDQADMTAQLAASCLADVLHH